MSEVSIEESEEIDLDYFLKYMSKVLSKEKLRQLKEFIKSNTLKNGEIIITSDSLALFLLNCGLRVEEVIEALKLFGLNDKDIDYIISLVTDDRKRIIDPEPGYSR